MNIVRSRLWRWTKRVIAGMVGLVLVLLLAGVVFQFVMTRIDARRYPAPGEMVEVGGYSLHLYCTGEPGAPTVVMDSGLGGTNMQVYASQYPNQVAGMVLVDSALEDEEAVTFTKSLQPSPLLLKFLATIGATRLPYTLGAETPGLTSPELEDEQAAISSHRKHIFAVADETSSLEESFAENRAHPMSLGDKPLMVLTAESVQTEGTGLSPEQANQLDKLHS
jgi:pimeloyl-ACP methyl ester carboxylesterase